jgi:hypothetical protein
MTEIRELRQQLAQPSAPVAERLDVQEARTEELAQSKVETSQRMPVSLTGMLLFNAFANGRYGGGLQEPVAAGLNPSARNSGATFRQTVLGLKFDGPQLPGGGKATGSFYMDFWGGTAAAGNNLFRVRLATIDLAWKYTTVTVGQDKPIVAPREPASLAQVGLAPLTGAGNLWNWQPTARIEQRLPFGEDFGLRAQAGVYMTAEAYPGTSAAAFSGTLERARPSYQGRFFLYKGPENRRFEIAPGFSFGQSHVAGASVASKLFTLDWMAKPNRWLDFSGAFFKGDNAAGLGSLRQGFTVLASGAVYPVHVNAGWGQLSFIATPRLSFHLFGGGEFDSGTNFAAAAVSRNLSYAGNAMYKLAPNVLAALEISQLRTTYANAATRLNNHYDLAIAYLF